ncbi:hypothetical protein EV360DRAFT_76579 [Lentinula raphanica]|nr:hypothetical protein EV360DRAFT_76579 [Lentinula raphanica]
MYLFRNSTWHSLLATTLLLSMIATGIAAPMAPKKRLKTSQESTAESSTSNAVAKISSLQDEPTRGDAPGIAKPMPPKKKSKASQTQSKAGSSSGDATGIATPIPPREKLNTSQESEAESSTLKKTYSLKDEPTRVEGAKRRTWEVYVIIHGGAAFDYIDPTALISVIFREVGKNPSHSLGYRVDRDWNSKTHFKWHLMTQKKGKKKGKSTAPSEDGGNKDQLFGVAVRKSTDHREILIATATYPDWVKPIMFKHMRRAVKNYRLGQLPNTVSTFQFLYLLQGEFEMLQKSDETVFTVTKFDFSAYEPIFENMLRFKGTGAGECLDEERDRWEWALYERIESGQINLIGSLERNNAEILEELWDKVHWESDPLLVQNVGKKTDEPNPSQNPHT